LKAGRGQSARSQTGQRVKSTAAIGNLPLENVRPERVQKGEESERAKRYVADGDEKMSQGGASEITGKRPKSVKINRTSGGPTYRRYWVTNLAKNNA